MPIFNFTFSLTIFSLSIRLHPINLFTSWVHRSRPNSLVARWRYGPTTIALWFSAFCTIVESPLPGGCTDPRVIRSLLSQWVVLWVSFNLFFHGVLSQRGRVVRAQNLRSSDREFEFCLVKWNCSGLLSVFGCNSKRLVWLPRVGIRKSWRLVQARWLPVVVRNRGTVGPRISGFFDYPDLLLWSQFFTNIINSYFESAA